MLYMNMFRITSVTLFGMLLAVALTACGGGTEPLAAGNGSPILTCLGQGGNTGCGGGIGGGTTGGTGTGNGTTTQVLRIDNAAFVSSIAARTVDAMVAVGTLLQVMLPSLINSATLPTCAEGGQPTIFTNNIVVFNNCTLPAMSYAVSGKLTWANVGTVNDIGLSGTSAQPDFLLIKNSTVVTKINTTADALTAGLQPGTNPSITLQLNSLSNVTPVVDIIPGGGTTTYGLTSSANAQLNIQLLTAPDGSPRTLTNMTGSILHIPRTGDEVSVAVTTLPWNGPSPGTGTLSVTDGTSTITLNVDSGSNVGISMTTNAIFSGQCETLGWGDLVTGSDAVTTVTCS